MAKRMLSDEPDRTFVQKTQWSEVTETICVKIQDFTEKIDDLENKKEPIDSPKFTIAGKELSVGIYPEDWRENAGEFISVSLSNDSKESITATVNCKSSSGGNRSVEKKLIGAGNEMGFSQFLSHEDFKKWAWDNEDIFSLQVEVTLHVKGPATWTIGRTKPKLQFDPIREASMMWGNNNEEDFTDFAILSEEGTRFPCHRVFLASQSAPLKAMMTRDTKEKEEAQVKLQYKEDVVRGFVGSFYAKKIPQEILEGNLESFLTLADSYDLATLKLEVEEAAVQLLSTENMVDMLYLGDLYHAKQLKVSSEFLISKNKEIIKEMDLSRFPANIYRVIIQLI